MEKKVITNKKLVFVISQLKSNDELFTLQELNVKLFTPLNFLEYNSILSTLKNILINIQV